MFWDHFGDMEEVEWSLRVAVGTMHCMHANEEKMISAITPFQCKLGYISLAKKIKDCKLRKRSLKQKNRN